MFEFRVLHVHRIEHVSPGVETRLDSLFELLRNQGHEFMTIAQDIKDQQERTSKALGNVAGDVRELLGKIAGGISAEEAEAIKARGEELVSGLEALAGEYTSAGEAAPTIAEESSL